MSNIITVTLTAGKVVKTSPLFQWDYGQIMQFQGAALPASFEVHFANVPEVGAATVQVGSNNQVEIPNEYLITGLPVYAWIFLSAGETDGETDYASQTPVIRRPMPAGITIPSAQQTAVQQAIAALNAAADRAGTTFGKSSITVKGVTVSRAGNTITVNGTGTESGTVSFNLSGGGILLADGSDYTLPLKAGHSYAMSGTFTGTAQNPSPAPIGNLVSFRLDGAGIQINKELPSASGAVLSEDADGTLLLTVRLGTTAGGTMYPITYTDYQIELETEDRLTIE